jgi:glycerate kinase
MKVLIVPDKFKGTLTASAASEAIARGWKKVRRKDSTELLPMSDGGDGFGEIISRLLAARIQKVPTVDAAHRPLAAHWWWEPKSKLAIIESARVIGLALLPPGKYHPFELDTLGLGQVLLAASEKGARRCLMGIGGSATNDAGFGLARSLGWQFSNQHGQLVERWTELFSLAQIHRPMSENRFAELLVAVDVQNPLLGLRGCTRIYGPQKGLRPSDFPLADRCLHRLAGVVKKQLELDCVNEPGAGAAGGLGYGLRCFAGAQLVPGFALFDRFARLREKIRAADLVITGEGALDASTLMGKGVGEVAALCRREKVPCVGLAGVVSDPEAAERHFTEVHGITPALTTSENALAEPARWLETLAAQIAERWTQSPND